MADNRRLVEDSRSQESVHSLLSEEWMIIDETEGDSITKKTSLESCDNKDYEDDVGNMQNNADIAYEKHDVDKSDSDDAAEKLIDDSDEISIITESDNEQLIIGKDTSNINEINESSYSCTRIQKLNQADDKPASQVGTIFNIIIACSLAAVIGLGAGRILSIDECTISNDVDFASVKMKNDFLINQLKELNGVKDVLDEIKASIPKVTSGNRAHSDSYSDDVTNGNVNSKVFDKSSKSDRKPKINADSKIVERLKNSLENLCSVIDDTLFDKSKPFTKQLCQSHHVVNDLMIFEKIISEVLHDSMEKTSEIRVLQNAEKKINNVCRSLLFDLSNSVHGIATKIYRKLEKVNMETNKKLCTLQKEANSEFFKKLSTSHNFSVNCERMSNVTRNSEKSTKVDGITKGMLKSSDNSEHNKRQRTWKNKKKATSKKTKLEFLNNEFCYRHDEDTCSAVQLPLFIPDSKNDINFDEKSDTEHICISTTDANAKKFNVKQSDKMSKKLNTANVKDSKATWNKEIRDSKISKKNVEERRDSKMYDSSENVQDHSKDTYASKVKSLKNKMDYRGDENHEPGSNQEECSTGKLCLKQKGSSEQTDDNRNLKDSKRSKKKSKHKLLKRQRGPKMDKHLTENESQNPADNIERDMHDGEWQLQRSKAREVLRDRGRASDWYFDRAGSRRDARKYEDQPELINDNYDEEWEDFWIHTKDERQFGKRDTNREFSSRKNMRSTFKTHRQNIMKEKRR